MVSVYQKRFKCIAVSHFPFRAIKITVGRGLRLDEEQRDSKGLRAIEPLQTDQASQPATHENNWQHFLKRLPTFVDAPREAISFAWWKIQDLNLMKDIRGLCWHMSIFGRNHHTEFCQSFIPLVSSYHLLIEIFFSCLLSNISSKFDFETSFSQCVFLPQFSFFVY